MRIDKLKVGQVIKNYKELCTILEIKETGGDSKKSQLKKLETYVNYHKEGNKFIIDKIYKTTKNKIDNRRLGGNKVYKDDFRKLMLHMLHIDKSENMLISKGSLYEAMNLVNPNYKLGKQDIDRLSKVIEIPKEYISDFYSENNKKIRENTERNLKSLRGESLLVFDIVTAVAIEKINIAYNELGTPIIENGKVLHCKSTEYRKATKKEKQIILRCESKAKAELGFTTDKEVFINGAWGTYSKLVTEYLKGSKSNIHFYYKAYEITWNKNKIEEEYNKLDKNESRIVISDNINANIVKSVSISCKTRHTKSKSTDTTDMKDYKLKKIKLHSSKDYIQNCDKLTNVLINKNAPNLKDKFKNITIKQMEFEL